ncbi:protein strawberry notch homolog 1-like [Diadema antillarum]|uniref:protein strawberry notch homolog 1-like n=1 Tax=Diadema antillarum TaxID=105358 RepID=UPI003A8C749A
MGDAGNPPDLLSAALCESGLSLDDILNPEPLDEEENNSLSTDASSVLAQAMAASGVDEQDADPFLEMLQDTPSSSALPVMTPVSTVTQNIQMLPVSSVPSIKSKPTIVIRQVSQAASSPISSPTSVLKIISSKPDGQQIVTTKPIFLTTAVSEQATSGPSLASGVNRGSAAAAKQFVKFVVKPCSPDTIPASKPRQTIVLNDTKPAGLVRSHTDSALLKPSLVTQTKVSQPKVSQPKVSQSKVSQPKVNYSVESPSTVVRNGSALLKAMPFLSKSNEVLPSASQGGSKALKLSRRHPMRIVDDDDDDLDDDETMGLADTYANYTPSKLKIGQTHPDPVVETSSLASVQPPNVWYHLSIPESTMDYGHLSSLQLEAITYACQQHETRLPGGSRAGFLIGDGAGVGKGRTVAGIILENYILGRKRALWLSVSNDLKYDAMRDLKDIGAGNIPVHSLNKFKYAKINSTENGHVRKGVIFATYSSLIGESQNRSKYRTRLKQLLHWCGKDFDGVIVLDECHKAKNLVPTGSSKPTKTGVTVLELQKQLPKARVVYCSATGASEPRNMAYMSRLGIWGKGTAFPDFNAFIQAIERRGVGAMEVVAMDMKLRGTYLARQLSFQGVTFKIKEVALSESFKKIYNKSVNLWHMARDRFQKAALLMDADQRMFKSMWGQFWSAHQRFFKYLCIAAKVKHVVKLARESVKNGKCVVIGLQSTGEARTLDALEEAGGELNDFVSTARGVFTTLIEKHFPVPDRNKTMSMLGLSFNGANHKDDDDNREGRGKGKGKKRKVGKKWKKKGTTDWWGDDSESSSGDDEDDDDDGDDPEKKKKEKKTSKNKEDEDESSDSSSSNSSAFFDSDNDEDDFNPFGNSDSDDDPWLNRSGRKSKEPKAKRRKKDKKYASSFSGKSSARNSSHIDSVDSAADNALRALGILPKTPRSLSVGSAAVSTLHSLSSSVPSATKSSLLPGMDAYERGRLMRQELMDTLEELSSDLPPNTLDELIDELGGPDSVAEMTGRKGRVVSHDNGVQYESRSECDIPLEILNLTEKRRFMDGDKYIAIISEAASSGISLQADRRVANQKRRVHITLELPWSADRAVQQFGRTHRSNQVAAPEYVFLISELAGEQRFASIVAKRLESLGALTHGDRRATESKDLSRFNIDTKYGREALELIMRTIIDLDAPIVEPPGGEQFFTDVKKALVGVGLLSFNEEHGVHYFEKDYSSIPKFLNRLLGMEVETQNALFKYFSDTMVAIISRAKKDGQWDAGIMDIGNESQVIRRIHTDSYIALSGNSTTELHQVGAERGLSWKSAIDIWSRLSLPEEGFYISQLSRFGRKSAILARFSQAAGSIKKGAMQIFKPNIGLQSKTETVTDLKTRFRKVLPDEAKQYWEALYSSSENKCAHVFWKGTCKANVLGLPCEIGLRRRTFHVLSGSVLSVWSRVEEVLALNPQSGAIMQIIRIKTDRGKLVGLLIPSNCVPALKDMLSKNATCYSETF